MKFYETPVAEVTAFESMSLIMMDIDDVYTGDDDMEFGSLV